MVLTERQKDILYKTIFEYIDRAQPISSSWLEERYELPFSSATIRSELSSLAGEGYLEQPHTSAGRVPTDRGYRFFVNESLEKRVLDEEDAEDESDFSDLVLAYHRNILWKEGWEHLLQEPEFTRAELRGNFTKFLLDVEQNIERALEGERLQVYIGRENPFSRIVDFSIIVCECDFAKGQNGFVAIVGPKRMRYHKNIRLIQPLVDIWKKRLKR